MRQFLKNIIGSWLNNYDRCDACGNTLWGEDGFVVYTKEPLPKLHYFWGSRCWDFCSKCNPQNHIADSLIQRTYQQHGNGLLCIDCGREHPANVCYNEMSEEEVRERGTGFPMIVEAGETVRFVARFAIPKEALANDKVESDIEL